MALQPLQANGLVPATDFPAQDYDALHAVVMAKLPDSVARRQFIKALHAVAYRYDAMARAQSSLRRSIAKYGTGPANPVRARQEDALFSFFGAAVSAFDSFHFSMFALGAYTFPLHFPFASPKDERKINIKSTHKAYSVAYPGEALLNVFSAFDADLKIQELVQLRNILTHRIAFARNHHMVVGAAGGDWTEWAGVSMNPGMLNAWRPTVSQRLSALMAAAVGFANRKL